MSRDDYPLSEWKKRSWIVLRGYAKTRSFSHESLSYIILMIQLLASYSNPDFHLVPFGGGKGVAFQILAVVLVTCIRVVARRRTPKFNW